MKSERISPREIQKQEIVKNFKSTFFRGIGGEKDDPLSNGGKTPLENNIKTPISMQRRLTRVPSPK